MISKQSTYFLLACAAMLLLSTLSLWLPFLPWWVPPIPLLGYFAADIIREARAIRRRRAKILVSAFNPKLRYA